MSSYAQDFYEIPETVEENDELRERIRTLVSNEALPGKVTEGGERVEKTREILDSFFRGDISLQESIDQVSEELPRRESQYAHNNRVFPDNWDERLIRTQISRFYNQAVLETLEEQGEDECFVPSSDHQKMDSPCTLQLADGTAPVDDLLDRLIRAYREGEWHEEVMIPDHPHCTHTVTPQE
jgi:hypothetical protein